MKNLITVTLLFWTIVFTTCVWAQSDTKHIRKEVQLEQLNDKVVLTIMTIDGDNITEEVYTDEEAEKMLEELEKVDEKKIVSSQEVKEEIHLEEVEGLKKLTVKRTENGQVSEKIFFGEEAENKIKEIESRENMQLKIQIED